MKKMLSFALFVIVCISACLTACGDYGGSKSSESAGGENNAVYASVKIMSINIAGQDMTEADFVSTVVYPNQTGHDYTYAKRRARLDVLIGEYTPDVLFLQEVNGNDWWWPYLVSDEDSFLNTFTDYTLVGRTNRVGGTDGAGGKWHDLYNQLYYNHSKFTAAATGMFYLNVKRTEPFSAVWHESAYYSSDDNATCVWAVLKDKKTGVSAVYASTHLKPTGGFLARKLTNYRQAINLAEGLYEIADNFADEGGALPIVVGGDFNLPATAEYNYAYPHMTVVSHYSDAQKIAEKTDNSGTARVWGKNKKATSDDGSVSDGYRIDMFFTQGMKVKRYQCLNGTFVEDLNGVYYTPERLFDGSAYDLSDHLPVMINAEIPSRNRQVKPPEDLAYVNDAHGKDEPVVGGQSRVERKNIVFTASDIVGYFGESQYMRADAVVHPVYGGVLRLMATESCPNVFAYFDYGELMKDKGLSPADIGGCSKIKIIYKTSFTAQNGEFVIAVLNEGDENVSYGINTTPLPRSDNFTEKVLELKKGASASGNITDILFGTMAYSEDYSGVCGLLKGDCVYVRSIEFIA